MNFPQFAIFRNQVSSAGLNLLDIVLDLDRVIPSDVLSVAAVLAFGILNDILKALELLKHHRLLAVNHLSTHRIIEIGNLFKGYAFLVELLGVFGDVDNRLRDLETVLTENASILNKSNKTLTVVNLEKTALLMTEVELHKLSGHLVLVLLVGILKSFLDLVNPRSEKILLISLDLSAKILSL